MRVAIIGSRKYENRRRIQEFVYKLKEKWGDKFPEQDYADAVCIALWNKRRLVEC